MKRKCVYGLSGGRCFLSYLFNEEDLDIFEKMAIICIRNRLAHDDLSLEKMRRLYKRLREIVMNKEYFDELR